MQVIGFKDAMTSSSPPCFYKGAGIALAITALLIAFIVAGCILDFEEHDQFLFGIGNIRNANLPWSTHAEPIQALSIPTWTIHLMSVFEYIVAMNLVWKFAKVVENTYWKGLTWAMLPMHASSICAVTHHFFYNQEGLQFLVTTQAGLTCLGNTTTMIAAFQIAKSNGWTVRRACARAASNIDGGTTVLQRYQRPLQSTTSSMDSNAILIAKLIGVTIVASYVIKYGEIGIQFPTTPDAAVALAMIIGIPAITASYFAFLSICERRQPMTFSLDVTGSEKEASGKLDVVDEESPLLLSRQTDENRSIA